MKKFKGPNGTRFEYAPELEGYVYIYGISGKETHVHGGDLLAFFKYLMDECVEEAVQEVGGEPV